MQSERRVRGGYKLATESNVYWKVWQIDSSKAWCQWRNAAAFLRQYVTLSCRMSNRGCQLKLRARRASREQSTDENFRWKFIAFSQLLQLLQQYGGLNSCKKPLKWLSNRSRHCNESPLLQQNYILYLHGSTLGWWCRRTSPNCPISELLVSRYDFMFTPPVPFVESVWMWI